MLPKINDAILSLSTNAISSERKRFLQPLIQFIQSKIDSSQAVHLNFICTHNSRRSHFCQIWAQTIAYHFNMTNIFCYSGGTESTALFPKVAETLEKSGFKIKVLSNASNPIYQIQYTEHKAPILAFSKKYDDPTNPSSNFVAILTCSDANENCPLVAGAEKRIPLTFVDPKKSDGTSQQEVVYFETSREIATEMLYVFSHLTINHDPKK